MTGEYAGMKVNVVGLGATGLSLVRFLHAAGANIRVFDGNANAAGLERLRDEFPSVPFTQCDLSRDPLPASDMIALSPGVPRASFALAEAEGRGALVLGDIELFARKFRASKKIYAVTGSNGKTTTAQLTGAIARVVDGSAIVAGNVGLPVLDAAREHPQTQTWVLELSSFQLESTYSLECESATVLNVTDNHLDRYPSFFAYAASKERIFARARRQVINRDDRWSRSMQRSSIECRTFGASRPSSEVEYGIHDDAIARGNTLLLPLHALRIRGTHNVMNAMAAVALSESLNVSPDQLHQAISEFSGVRHRYEWIGNVEGVEVINDSKATTVVAASAALRGSEAPTWLIAGGDGKGQSFEALAEAAGRCRAIHLIGRDADAIAHALAGRGIPYTTFTTLEDATLAALDAAKAGDRVLLSPACASWDMFRNFEHRADVFINTVHAWAAARRFALSKERAHA